MPRVHIPGGFGSGTSTPRRPCRYLPAALRRYENARLQRTTAIVRGSFGNTKRFHNPAFGNPEGAAAYVERDFRREKLKQRYDWLYEYDALTVPLRCQTWKQ